MPDHQPISQSLDIVERPTSRAASKWVPWVWGLVIVVATVMAWPVGAAVLAVACALAVPAYPDLLVSLRRVAVSISGAVSGFAIGAAYALGSGPAAMTLWVTSLTILAWVIRSGFRGLVRDTLLLVSSGLLGAAVGMGVRRRMALLELRALWVEPRGPVMTVIAVLSLFVSLWTLRDLLRRHRIAARFGAPQADFYRKGTALRMVLLLGTAPLIVHWLGAC